MYKIKNTHKVQFTEAANQLQATKPCVEGTNNQWIRNCYTYIQVSIEISFDNLFEENHTSLHSQSKALHLFSDLFSWPHIKEGY